MTVHNVSELTGALLDLAVGIALGHNEIADPATKKGKMPRFHEGDIWIGNDGARGPKCFFAVSDSRADYFEPSTNPAQGQPIAEREWIGVDRPSSGQQNPVWRAITEYKGPRKPHRFYEPVEGRGATMLEAMMRAFVASKVGKTIELPDIG